MGGWSGGGGSGTVHYALHSRQVPTLLMHLVLFEETPLIIDIPRLSKFYFMFLFSKHHYNYYDVLGIKYALYISTLSETRRILRIQYVILGSPVAYKLAWALFRIPTEASGFRTSFPLNKRFHSHPSYKFFVLKCHWRR